MHFKLIFLSLLLLCYDTCLANAAEVKEENDVLVLDRTNFNEVVQEKDTLLVEFYAPWCGHCKQLEPNYAAAAKKLKADNIALAKVDATLESGLASDYGVEGYPTMKIFKKSIPGESFDYEGPRDTDGIVKFMKQVAQPSWKPPYQLSGLKELTSANISEALEKQNAWLVGYLKSEDDRQLLESVANSLKRGRDKKAVGLISSVSLADSYGLSSDAVGSVFAVIRQSSKKATVFGYDVNADNLEKFYRAHSTPDADSMPQFDKLSDIESINDGLESVIIGQFSEESEIKTFFRNFLLESGYFYDRRLEGGRVSDKLAQQLKLKQDRIYVRKPTKLLSPNEEQLIEFTSNQLNAIELKRFYDSASLPLIGYFTWNTKEVYRKATKPVCLFFLSVAFKGESLSSTQLWHRKFAKAAKPFADSVLFAMVDDEQDEDELKSFKLDDSSADVNIGCYDKQKRRYAMPEMDSFDTDEVQEFVKKLLAGKLQQTLRSVTAKSSAITDAAVLQLTGDTFNKLIINDNDKHSVVIMCDISLQPCAKSVEEFTEAANSAQAKQLSNVRFAQLDTKYNDAPGNYFYEFNPLDIEMTQPMVLLGKINAKNQPIRFDKSAVTKDYIIQFINHQLGSGKTEL